MAEPFIQKVIVPALVDLYFKEKREGKPKPSDRVPPIDAVEEMARRWYGFGAWDAPFWFIGPEPGAIEDSPTYLKACAAAWMNSGGTELVDCIQYHRELGYPAWHSARAPLQPTWRALIRMLLIATGRRVGTEQIRAYQRLVWGTRDGETAVMELCSKAVTSLRTHVDRGSYQAERIECLRNKIRDHKPQFVVMYGIGQKQHWEAIAGGAFTSDGLKKVGQTVMLMTPHPQARGTSNADWDRFGKVLLNAGNRK